MNGIVSTDQRIGRRTRGRRRTATSKSSCPPTSTRATGCGSRATIRRLTVRHFFYDWDTEKPSSLQIERLGDEVEAETARCGRMSRCRANSSRSASSFTTTSSSSSTSAPAPPANGFLPPIDRTAIGAAAENKPVIGRWELEPDEALILEVEPPEGVYWSYSLGNPWWETIHYGRHQSSLNAHQAVVDSDGLVRVVLCGSRDPGVANWLDTAGHSNGAMILRCVRTDDRADTASPGGVRSTTSRRRCPPTPRRSPRMSGRAILDRTPARRTREVRTMTFSADELEDGARAATGLDDFGSPYYREGLERTVDALNTEADLYDMGTRHPARHHQQCPHSTAEDRGHLQAAPRDRRRNHRRPSLCHRAAPHRNHRTEPTRGRRPPVPVTADVGVAGAAPRRRRRPPSTPTRASRRPKRECNDGRHVPADEDACTTPKRPAPRNARI